MADYVDRVNKLIALSTSDTEAEATQAAVLAVKLIRQHGIPVGGGAARVSATDVESIQLRLHLARVEAELSQHRSMHERYRAARESIDRDLRSDLSLAEKRAQSFARELERVRAEHETKVAQLLLQLARAKTDLAAAQAAPAQKSFGFQAKTHAANDHAANDHVPPPPDECDAHERVVPTGIDARYRGKCRMCGDWYEIDEPVLWHRLMGITHVNCATYWSLPTV